MAEIDADENLNRILKKTQALSEGNLLPDEITFLTSLFLSTRSDAATIRSKAYVVLSAYCQAIRDSKRTGKGQGNETDQATKVIVNTFGPRISDYLADTSEPALLSGISFLTALFQVDSQAASAIFVEDGLVENVTDTVDLTPSLLLCQEVAHLLGQASGNKSCRGVMTPQIVRWLEFKSRQNIDLVLRSAASVALIKLAKGSASDAPENGTPEVQSGQSGELVERMVDIITSGTRASAVDAVEGLAYLSTDPSVKETLAKNSTFLKSLFDLVPKTKITASRSLKSLDPTLIYGVLVIICNLTSFRPRLTEEQKQIENLKKMAKAGQGPSESASTTSLDDDDCVKGRIHFLVGSGVLPVFAAAVSTTDTPGVRASVGKALLSITEEKENRGKILQAGGAKVLQTIIKQLQSTQPEGMKSKQTTLAPADLEAIQALAKLAITSSPVQVFGPNVGAIYDSIRPFSILLQHPSSNLLQRFEAIMALTNLASESPVIATRISKADGLLDHVELLLLEDHILVRRASVELICNLIAGSDDTFQRYSGESPSSVSKIHILLALSDVDDLPTQLASSGALATLTAAPSACTALVSLQFEKNRFLSIMTQLIDPSCLPNSETADREQALDTNPGLVHRGVVCVSNVFQNVADVNNREKLFQQGSESGLIRALFQLVKGEGVVKDPAIMQPAAEALKAIMKRN